MAENNKKKPGKEFKPEDRFKFIGFEVGSSKPGDLFKSDAEKESWVKRVIKKREKGEKGRDHCTLTEERVEGYERIVLTITSLLLVVTLFMPWFSGYKEFEVEAKVEPAPVEEQVDAVADSVNLAVSDSLLSDTDTIMAETTVTEELSEELATTTEETIEDESTAGVTGDKDAAGFTSITAVQQRREIRKEHQSLSAVGALISIGSVGGKVFSSGFILIITGILLIIYILLCLGIAGYTLYIVYGSKGDADQKALILKKGLVWNWMPVAVWFFMLAISFIGASYSFDSSGMIAQLGSNYGIGAFLGVLSYGFYISLACFIMNAVKASEI
jgi:hypothetical protein